MRFPPLNHGHPAVARVYDYWLGGCHNFRADRALGDAIAAALPGIASVAQANRAFLQRAAEHLANIGIDQFLDLGSGPPTIGNVHEIVQGSTPSARVVYIDSDPIVIAHRTMALRGNHTTVAIQGDLRYPADILANPQVRRLLDLTRPIAVLMVAALHYVPDAADPAAIIAAYADAMAAGSPLLLSHVSTDWLAADQARKVELARQNCFPPVTPVDFRTAKALTTLLEAWGPLASPVAPIQSWWPRLGEPKTEDPSHPVTMLAGLAHKPL